MSLVVAWNELTYCTPLVSLGCVLGPPILHIIGAGVGVWIEGHHNDMGMEQI